MDDGGVKTEVKLPPGCGCLVVLSTAIIGTLATAAAILGLIAALKFLIEFIVR